jgi:hypothetical protein
MAMASTTMIAVMSTRGGSNDDDNDDGPRSDDVMTPFCLTRVSFACPTYGPQCPAMSCQHAHTRIIYDCGVARAWGHALYVMRRMCAAALQADRYMW